MKHFRLSLVLNILVAANLPGCGSVPDDPLVTRSGQGEVTPSPYLEFFHTESYDELRIHQAAAKMISSGQALSSALAEICWNVEKSRVAVRETCMLAWAAGNEASAPLEEALLAQAPGSRVLAIALVRRKSSIHRITLSQLLSMLSSLAKDPPWVRALAIDEWLKANDAPSSVMETRALWHALAVDPGSPGLEPASASLAYRIARKLDVGREEELLTAFCAPSAGSFAQVRCWRFLSAIVDPVTGLGLDKIARSFLPSKRDDGWTLFERAFPERAILLQQYR